MTKTTRSTQTLSPRGGTATPGKAARHKDQKLYESTTFGSIPIKDTKDLPSLKMRFLMELLQKRKRPSATLLEVGCGTGRILSTIHERDPRLKLSGVDISKTQISIARRECKGIAFLLATAERLPFRDNSFDYVIFMDVIEHVENPDTMLREIHRVLKPGGYLYGGSPAEGHGIYWLSKKIFGRHFKEEVIGHIQQYTVADLHRRVRKAGLRIQYTKYSYHVLGSIMDYSLFTLMLNRRIKELFLEKNQYWRTKETKQTAASKSMNALLALGNAVAYYESSALRDVRWTATAVHIVAQKPQVLRRRVRRVRQNA
jgi:ubiquinone/menaquinone biosynthesis C-methylase UbiE